MKYLGCLAIRNAMLSFMSTMVEAQTIVLKEAKKAGIADANQTKRMLIKGANPASRWSR